MSIVVNKGSDLLPLAQVQALAPKDLKAFNESAAKFAAEFNAAYPEGKAVAVNIKRIVITDRVNFIVDKHPDLSSQSFSFPFSIADILAANVGCKTAEGLELLTRTSLQPLKLSMTVKAVTEGETYETATGSKTYKTAAMVKVDKTREEVVLSTDASQVIGEISREALKEIIMGGASGRKSIATAVVPAGRPAIEEEADV